MKSKKNKQKGGFIFFRNKNKESIKNLCKYTTLDDIKNKTRASDSYLIQLCPNLNEQIPNSRFSFLFNTPKSLFNYGYNKSTELANSVKNKIFKGGSIKNRNKNRNRNRNIKSKKKKLYRNKK